MLQGGQSEWEALEPSTSSQSGRRVRCESEAGESSTINQSNSQLIYIENSANTMIMILLPGHLGSRDDGQVDFRDLIDTIDLSADLTGQKRMDCHSPVQLCKEHIETHAHPAPRISFPFVRLHQSLEALRVVEDVTRTIHEIISNRLHHATRRIEHTSR